MDIIARWPSPIGMLTMRSDGNILTGLWFEGQKCFPEDGIRGLIEAEAPIFDRVKEWLRIYFSGTEPSFAPPVRLMGTAFEMSVWSEIAKIPYAKTASYNDIALSIRKKGGTASARAVGRAVGKNAVSLIIPCHRVIGSNGSLTGYAGGLERKRFLLALERSGADNSVLLL